MFAGFNLFISNNKPYINHYSKGEDLYLRDEESVHTTLDKYLFQGGALNATKIQDEWFPEIDADIFISHSHKDKSIAIGLAGWLYETFELTCFIDSCIWGYADNLLRKIIDKYCVEDNGHYDYDSVAYAASHVHMMLTTRLMSMIDKTECVFLLNTPNTITSAQNAIRQHTQSPWIYMEIFSSELIRKKKLSEYRMSKGLFSENENIKVKYDVSLDHLYELNNSDLFLWKYFDDKIKGTNALNYLYDKKIFNKKFGGTYF